MVQMAKEKLTAWSRYPVVKVETATPRDLESLKKTFENFEQFVAYGCGRSYGDAPLGPQVVKTERLRFFSHFDEATGELIAEAGVTLEEIIKHFLPRGWFLPVTPGTKFVTLGGAVAADVHGKNHHRDGSFSRWVTGLKLLMPDGREVFCSPDQNEELFRATCGGMGLTGFIFEVRLKLRRVPSSYIRETIIKCRSLEESLAVFEEHEDAPYSVSWLDCTASGKEFGRSLLMLGDHFPSGGLHLAKEGSLNFPLDAPTFTLNPYSIRLFNTLYYSRVRGKVLGRTVLYEEFFYPLDRIQNWNRLYGKNGFLQYQFVVPKEAGRKAIKEVLHQIRDTGEAPFLSVLKLLGKGNDYYLSFPMEGYILALDFKLTPRLFTLLQLLDEIVHYYGGRIYLAKDARLSRPYLEQGYPKLKDFIALREKWGLKGRIESFLSKRLGI